MCVSFLVTNYLTKACLFPIDNNLIKLVKYVLKTVNTIVTLV